MFVIESEKCVLLLHRRHGVGSFVLLQSNCDREFSANLAFFAASGPRIIRLLAAKNLQCYMSSVNRHRCTQYVNWLQQVVKVI